MTSAAQAPTARRLEVNDRGPKQGRRFLSRRSWPRLGPLPYLRRPLRARRAMTTIEIIEPKLSRTERDDLERAIGLIERDSLAESLPAPSAATSIGSAAGCRGREGLGGDRNRDRAQSALKVAVSTRGGRARKKSADRWHKAAAAASGAVGGAFGLVALAIELPISTTILLQIHRRHRSRRRRRPFDARGDARLHRSFRARRRAGRGRGGRGLFRRPRDDG